MAKPNYSFEKRQREMAKKKKKEEKLRDKADRKVGDNNGADDSSPSPENGPVDAAASERPAA